MKFPTLFLLLALSGMLRAEDPPRVILAGIQMIFDDGGEDFGGFRVFNREKGTTAALIIRGGEKDIVAADEGKAKVTIGGAPTKASFFASSTLSTDRRSLRLEFETAEKVKTTEGGSVKIEGEIPVTFALGKDETRSEVFSVAKDSEIQFPEGKQGFPALKVKEIEKPTFNEDAQEVTFTINQRIDDFAGVKFYTKDGKEVEYERRSYRWMGVGRGSGEVSFSFKEEHDELVIAIESWTGVEEKILKVDLSASFAAPE